MPTTMRAMPADARLVDTSLRWAGVWSGLPGWLLVAGLTLAAWLIVWRQSRRVAGVSRWLLPSLRAAAVALTAMLLLGPTLHTRRATGELGRLAIVLDDSASMARRDPSLSGDRAEQIARALDLGPDGASQLGQLSRWDRAAAALSDGLLAELRERHEVRLLRLTDGELVPWERDDRTEPAPRTDLVAALKPSLVATESEASKPENSPSPDGDEASAPPSAAIVLLTDGQHTEADSPIQAARILGAQRVLAHPVGFGPLRPAPDRTVRRISVPDRIAATDRLTGEIVIGDAMPAGERFTVRVLSGDRTLWTEELTGGGDPLRTIPFAIEPDAIAAALPTSPASPTALRRTMQPLELTAAIDASPGETDADNNARTTATAVALRTTRVLLLDGRPRWETRYLRNALDRDPQWDLRTVIAGPLVERDLPRGEGGFPATRDELLAFDLIVLGEMPAELLTGEPADWIADFVAERGGGLVAIGSPRGTLRDLPPPLAALLPAEWLPDGAIRARSLRLTPRGASLPALRLQSSEEANRRFWRTLPPPRRVVAVRPLPSAETLAVAESSDGGSVPAIVTQPVGAGQVVLFAFDETWRWRYRAADRWHQRFWNQLLGYVLPQPFAVADRQLALDSGGVRYDAGEAVPIRVRLDGDWAGEGDRIVEAVITPDEGEPQMVALSEDAVVSGLFRGAAESLPPGRYAVTVRTADYAADERSARTEFAVEPPETGELDETVLNEPLLQAIADRSGGRYRREEEIGDLVKELAPLSRGRVVESDRRIGETWWWMLAIVSLLTIEWVQRKRVGLL